jgi:hypothetical protein
MFWIILLFVAIGMMIFGAYIATKNMNWKETLGTIQCVFGIIIIIICLIIIPVQAMVGIGSYPTLVGQQSEIKVLQTRAASIKESYYQEQASPKALLNGSLTNISQSSRLSEYIASLAKKESAYNNDLAQQQIYVTTPIFWWFGTGMYIDKKVLKLKPF